MNILRELRKFTKYMYAKYPTINHGGCCVFAALVNPRLIKYIPNSRIRVLSYHDSDAESVNLKDIKRKVDRNLVYTWNDKGVYFSHVIIEFKYKKNVYHFDAERLIYKRNQYSFTTLYSGYLTNKDAMDLAIDNNGWNSSFNRRLISNIESDVKEFFRNLEVKHKLEQKVST